MTTKLLTWHLLAFLTCRNVEYLFIFQIFLVKMEIKITKEGTGKTIPDGSTVGVHYTGRLANGKVFDSSEFSG